MRTITSELERYLTERRARSAAVAAEGQGVEQAEDKDETQQTQTVASRMADRIIERAKARYAGDRWTQATVIEWGRAEATAKRAGGPLTFTAGPGEAKAFRAALEGATPAAWTPS